MPQVFIPNRSANDFSGAEEFGDIVFVTEGYIDQLKVNPLIHRIDEVLSKSSPDDYIVMSSLNVLCSLVTAVFALKHGRLNLLIFRGGSYVERTTEF